MEKRKIILITLLVFFSILLLPIIFYFINKEEEKKKAIEICLEECRNEILKGRDLFNGPCLLNPIKELPDWVCDVVNVPRQNIDNLRENQCSYYYEGKAKHFVEVSINCEFVRAH